MTSIFGPARRWIARTQVERALRDCDAVGPDAAIEGRPTVLNGGFISVGARFRLASSPVPSHLVTQHGGRIEIGHDVTIAHGAAIASHARITIGDGTRIGPFCVVMDTDFHVAGDAAAKHATSPVSIGRNVRIGSHVTILRGTVIGDGVTVESGSVVNGVTASNRRIGGVPARVLASSCERIARATDVAKAIPGVVMRALGLDTEPPLDAGRDQIPQWDSLGTLKLVLAIEEAFGVELDARELLHLRSIGSLVPIIEHARASGGSDVAPRRKAITFHAPRIRRVDPVFVPDPKAIEASSFTAFTRFVESRTGETFATADAFHAFSVERFREFWALFVEWSALPIAGEIAPVCIGDACETAVFFPSLRLNYAASLLREISPGDDDAPAITACNESGAVVRLTRGELRLRVLAVAHALRSRGITRGDRVVAIAANDADAVVACLACAAIGATWSSVSPELGVESILARFEQLSPKAIFHRTSYLDQGKRVDVASRVAAVLAGLPTLSLAIGLGERSYDARVAPRCASTTLDSLIAEGEAGRPALGDLELFPFNHPLFVMFSSGTTGRPKCIVHGAGGTLLEHHKEHRLHGDLKPSDKLYFHTTCAWMMWNWLISALSVGAEIVVYEGSVSYPEIESLWQLVARERVTVFGTSPAFLQFTATAGIAPNERCDLSRLRALMSTGSILPDTAFEWVHDHVAPVAVQSISGGTDIIGCFLLGHPALPVYAGELQSKSLGLDVRALGGTSATDGIGELVCANPFPSRPLGLYGDATGERFNATYFAQNKGYWTHGDRFEWTARGTGRIHGRSDGVMNIRGIRIGPAEIYAALADIEEIAESMAIEQRDAGEPGGSRLVLLVVLRDGKRLDAVLVARIRDVLASRCSRAHVPGLVLEAFDLPVTHNGKRAERAARDALNGDPVANIEALRNPECIEAIRSALTSSMLARAS